MSTFRKSRITARVWLAIIVIGWLWFAWAAPKLPPPPTWLYWSLDDRY